MLRSLADRYGIHARKVYIKNDLLLYFLNGHEFESEWSK